jgi:SAM-dependent methyltransferase
MDFLDRQTRYWDGAAGVKRFTHPLERGFFAGRVPKDARILDLGCGYGRIVSDLSAEGYGNVVGIDISGGMIERGRRLHPERISAFSKVRHPVPSGAFDMVLLFAVLTCVPTDGGQRALVSGSSACCGRAASVRQRLSPPGGRKEPGAVRGGSRRGTEPAGSSSCRRGPWSATTRPNGSGAVFAFRGVRFRTLDAATMNGNPAKIFQYLGRKR